MSFNEVAAPRGSETILIVDPDPETRKLAAFMLAKQGYTRISVVRVKRK